MPRKTHEEIAIAKAAAQQLKLQQRRDAAATAYKGGVAAFVTCPVGDEIKKKEAEKLIAQSGKLMRKAFGDAADAIMMRTSIEQLRSLR